MVEIGILSNLSTCYFRLLFVNYIAIKFDDSINNVIAVQERERK